MLRILLPCCVACGAPTSGTPVDPVSALFASFDDSRRAGELAAAVRDRVAVYTAAAGVSDRTTAPAALEAVPLPDGTVPGPVAARRAVGAWVDDDVDALRRLDAPDALACALSATRIFDPGQTCWSERLCRDAVSRATLTDAGPLSGAWSEQWTQVTLPDDGPPVDLWRAWRTDPGAAGFALELRAPDPADDDATWVLTAAWVDDADATALLPDALDAWTAHRAGRLAGDVACPEADR